MPDYDAGFKIVAHHAGRQLAWLGGIHCRLWKPITGELQATERLADRAFLASNGRDKFVVYMEAYTRWQKAAPWSVLAKSGLLSERERLPTRSLIFILLPRGYKPQGGTFRLEVEAAGTQQIWFREICLWQEQPQMWWEEHPGLMALYPLCRHRLPFPTALSHAAQSIAERTADTIQKADLLTTLAIFGKLAQPGFDVLKVIGREAMKESKLYQEIQEEGRMEGLVAGRTEGLVAGRVEARRADILGILEARFGTEAAGAFADAVAAITDPDRLFQLLRLAASCNRPADFRAQCHARKKHR